MAIPTLKYKQVNSSKHRSVKRIKGKPSKRQELREEKKNKSSYLVKWKDWLKGICKQMKQI